MELLIFFKGMILKKKVKKTMYENYGVYYNTQSPELLLKKRLNMEEKGLLIPLNELSKYQIYKNNVISFTNYNLRLFGDDIFGKNWDNSIGVNENHMDHIYSIKKGYIDKIKPYIIGSITNLRIIDSYNNISKGANCDISKNNLIDNFNKFEKEPNHIKLLTEMKNRRSKYYNLYFKIKNENEN